MNRLFDQVKAIMYEDNKRFEGYHNLKNRMKKKQTRIEKVLRSKHYIELTKRFKALLWSSSMMMLAALLNIVVDYINNSELEFSEYTIVTGLVLAQISKYLNKKK